MSNSKLQLDRLAVGTVQFGMEYGISNINGIPDIDKIKDIIDFSRSKGITTFDTAANYGNSEEILGNIGINNCKIITKIPKKEENVKNVSEWVSSHVHSSINKLNVSNVYAILIHNPNDLYSDLTKGKELWSEVMRLKDIGLTEKVGYSLYSPEELDMLWSDFTPDIVQIPYSIFNRTFKNTGWIDKLSECRVEIHARSIFLQGLLLMSKEDRPLKFEKWDKLWSLWDKWLFDNCLTALEACVNYAFFEEKIDKFIVGVESVDQISQIIHYTKSQIKTVPDEFNVVDCDLINPSNWSKL